MVPTMCGSRDGERMLKHNNGTLTKFLRLSRTTTGKLIHLTFKEMVNKKTSDVQLQTLDGGNYSRSLVTMS